MMEEKIKFAKKEVRKALEKYGAKRSFLGGFVLLTPLEMDYIIARQFGEDVDDIKEKINLEKIGGVL